jgi:hypothetical protein
MALLGSGLAFDRPSILAIHTPTLSPHGFLFTLGMNDCIPKLNLGMKLI